jgi:hypothetical protein
MSTAVVLAVAAAIVVGPALPAVADPSRMSLDCEGIDLAVERTNGTSWWGSDGAVYTTKHLRVVDDQGTYEKSYGHVVGNVTVCAADHVVEDYASRWTVQLVRSR